ncbi:MAG: DUF1446 domain-containing protein [Gammaproteobacteria bacterium]|jgi:hypothetical protein|nr:DUF1446 domain-containing protein [Gammaproteobacteria bacterium]
MNDRIVRIGGASASLADSAIAFPQLLGDGALDYLVGDYLAEGSMGLLAMLAQANPGGGYAPDFIPVHIGPCLAEIARQGVRVVVNAGGVNPHGCAAELARVAAEQGLSPRIAVVDGDDLMGRLGEFRAAGVRDMFSGAAFPAATVDSMNAYLGAFPIAAALARGAEIVITGRVVDSALVLGPLIHEFGWTPDAHDLLAAGTLAGHLLECGTQVSGGTFTDWRTVPAWNRIGYPIAECRADGTFVVTKAAGTGGLVSRGTVAEQLVYEVGDPQAYFVPDVSCDFSAVQLEEIGPDRVRVSGVRGRPSTASYKVCTIHRHSWRVSALQPIVGLEAAAKAERQAAALIERSRRLLAQAGLGDWSRTHVEVLGTEGTLGARARHRDAREVLLRIVLEHADRRAAEIFTREQHSSIVSMSPGTAIGLGNPVVPVQALFSFLVDKATVEAAVTIDGQRHAVSVPAAGDFDSARIERAAVPAPPPEAGPLVEVPLVGLAWARSGDKGNLFNVGVIARRAEFLPWIAAALTSAAVADWYRHDTDDGVPPRVERHALPGLHALNLVVHEALGGGITSSPRLDSVAKGKAQQLLCFPIPVPAALAALVDPGLLDFDSARPYEGQP